MMDNNTNKIKNNPEHKKNVESKTEKISKNKISSSAKKTNESNKTEKKNTNQILENHNKDAKEKETKEIIEENVEINTENNSIDKESQKDTISERKTLIYLVIIAILLLFFAQFFIHDIVISGSRVKTITDTQSLDDTTNDDNNDKEGNQQGNQGDNSEGTSDGNKNQTPNQTPIVNNQDRIIVTENATTGDTEWRELRELSIFRNKRYDNKALIAPGDEGIYYFTVENEFTNKYNYKIIFKEENPYNVNMVFKLRKNGQYILGSETEWKAPEGLDTEIMPFDALQKDVYTLEWRWEDAENDTQIGRTDGSYYKMYVDVQAEQVISQ